MKGHQPNSASPKSTPAPSITLLVFAVDKATCVNTRGVVCVGETIVSVITGTKGERSSFKPKSEVLLQSAENLMLSLAAAVGGIVCSITSAVLTLPPSKPSQGAPRGELPDSKTVGCLQREIVELRQFLVLAVGEVGMCGASPARIGRKNMGVQIPGSESSGAMRARGRGEKVCRSTRASPPEGATGCDSHPSRPNGAHRRHSRAKCRREICSGWRNVHVTLICS